MIVIAAAFKTEVNPVIRHFKLKNKIRLNEGTLYSGNDVSVITTGLGREKATRSLQSYLSKYSCNFLLNIGFSGALEEGLHLGQCFLIQEIVYPDSEYKPITLDMIVESELEKARLLTVDAPVLQTKLREKLRTQYDTILVDMEAYALADLCRKNKVPFTAIKTVSDHADKMAILKLMKNRNDLAKKISFAAIEYLEQIKISGKI